MKRFFGLALVAVLLALCVSPVSAAEFEFKMGLNNPVGTPRERAAVYFADLVAQESGGRINITVFPAETLGTEQEMIEAVNAGALDIQAAGGLATWVPQIDYTKMPFLFNDYEECYAVQDSYIGDKVLEKLRDKNMIGLAHWDLGFCQITNNVRPINSLEDVKGLKIRVPNEFIMVEIFKALGAAVTTMPYGEVYLALSQGVIDGQQNPMSAIYSSKFHEHQKYLAMTNHMYMNCQLIMSVKAWESLPKDLQDVMRSAAKKGAVRSRELVQADETLANENMQKEGVQFTYPDAEPFRQALMPVYEILSPKMGDDGPQIIKEVQEFLVDYRAKKQ